MIIIIIYYIIIIIIIIIIIKTTNVNVYCKFLFASMQNKLLFRQGSELYF